LWEIELLSPFLVSFLRFLHLKKRENRDINFFEIVLAIISISSSSFSLHQMDNQIHSCWSDWIVEQIHMLLRQERDWSASFGPIPMWRNPITSNVWMKRSRDLPSVAQKQ
jgi:hypothetical protein